MEDGGQQGHLADVLLDEHIPVIHLRSVYDGRDGVACALEANPFDAGSRLIRELSRKVHGPGL